MRIPRVYLPEAAEPGAELPLPEEAARHLVKALRLAPGDPVTVFSGAGGEHQAELAGDTKRPVVRLGDFRAVERESPLGTVLWAGLSKGEKFDWVVQKATELGVTEIRPVQTARSVRRLEGPKAAKNRDRWHRIAASACEQCGRNRIPEVVEPAPLETALASGVVHGLVLDEAGDPPVGPPAGGPLHLLVGPEGGLNDEELVAAVEAGFVRAALGPRTLRTETAAVAALAWAQAVWGDFPGVGA
ncbi:16S rRNA (uracil(1498)-N(3))-methyltransferase [Thiohalorhabdus methylotrophus]|uniref:Ribosomal RNA small subunit methyltransferase E n=1 Tax=Thiohalorhabdus methylotrophus TaxID=3242694 RepID=A0ABV4TQM2_9GAMM